jgi:CheY-like chemotaxis protein
VSGRSFFLIDDDKDDAFLIERAFKKTEPTVNFSYLGDGVAFQASLESRDILLSELSGTLLLDINMPRVSGFDVLEILHQHKPPTLTTIVLSTSESEVDRDRAFELGANGFQTKPRRFIDLVTFAEKLIR